MSDQTHLNEQQLMAPVFDPLASVMIRDSIIERLRDTSLDDLVVEVTAGLLDWETVSDPVAQRGAQRFALLLTPEEQDYFVWHLLSSFYPENAVDQPTNDGDVVGGEAILTTILVGVAASLAATVIWEIGKWAWNRKKYDPTCASILKEDDEFGLCMRYCIDARGYRGRSLGPCDPKSS